ncbi:MULTISPECIES: phage tail sheath subtilisin-like domain-containing protein [Photorhabdus]|uniref:Photorhabdus luminescens subsp. laumondii TTO1 complete genome segment 12/17 n=2 Tax=Photorhabdus TaxID=29487 RepID=Q7N1N9_PHOLL|nr:MULTISPECIES: phage tail sheath subtilisin-like domain-containing protein [Photorhabdus]AWK43098.1 phage tail protein [Photorhabdus laumondii subsp. laumondii]AXG48412.1 phage tail protein [Photorhabdus laumondii subsp. laumondii]KTL61638.1 phage tail protein [Photorhabdus laumondii subsp. laumondii]MCC8374038.1 phage tail sheath subtilisin-like domain-containing protein [Photorhabdus bodei]MCT8350377.1 phage tail sheath subtilisin-like domain-containing protein [Photorhabdus kayaii]
MAANYLHGVETIEIEKGSRPVKTVKSAVIGLIGTAPIGPVNAVTLCLSEKDAAQFGTQMNGFTIPQALDAIYDHGAGTVLVINVLDPEVHKANVASESISFDKTTGTAKLANPVVSNVLLKSTSGSAPYVEGQDYSLDAQTGSLKNIGKNIAAGATVIASYDFADPTLVTPADIIGSISAAGNRTGMKLLNDTYNLYGFFAKILLAPVYCTQLSVTTELIALATKLGAMTYIDAPIGTTFVQAISGRGPSGTINFNTSSDRVRLCYPHVKVYDAESNSERLEPLSSRAAGLRAKIDADKGFWWSSSNQEIMGITGIERQLSAIIDDPQSEVNQLNEQGITTVFNNYGSGLRLWGNRTAAWPTVTHMRNFENVRRTGDVINESLRYFSQQYIDMPITPALIDALTESVNAYGRKLIADGALLGFKCWFDPTHNEETELASGHLLLSYKYTPPPPLERLTFETEITSEYLLNLKGNN